MLLRKKLEQLKESVRDWMGTLSIEETITNPDLSMIFKRIEQKIQNIEEQYV